MVVPGKCLITAFAAQNHFHLLPCHFWDQVCWQHRGICQRFIRVINQLRQNVCILQVHPLFCMVRSKIFRNISCIRRFIVFRTVESNGKCFYRFGREFARHRSYYGWVHTSWEEHTQWYIGYKSSLHRILQHFQYVLLEILLVPMNRSKFKTPVLFLFYTVIIHHHITPGLQFSYSFKHRPGRRNVPQREIVYQSSRIHLPGNLVLKNWFYFRAKNENSIDHRIVQRFDANPIPRYK